MPLVFVDLFAPGRFNGFQVNQVTGFPDRVTLGGSTVLDDHQPLEVDAEIGDPFLNGLFNARIETFHPDLEAATVLGGALELLLGWLDGPLGHLEAVHELAGQKRDVSGDGNNISIPVRVRRPIDIVLHARDDFVPRPGTGDTNGRLEETVASYGSSVGQCGVTMTGYLNRTMLRGVAWNRFFVV